MLEVFLLDAVFVHEGSLVDGLENGIVETLEVGGRKPFVLNPLQIGTVLARGFGRDHEVVERLEVGVGGTEDEPVVAGVDGGGDESGSFGVGTTHGDEVRA